MVDMADIHKLEEILTPGELLDIINIEVNIRGEYIDHKLKIDETEQIIQHL